MVKKRQIDGDVCFVDYTSKKPVEDFTSEFLNFKWGNGDKHRKLLTDIGYNYICI